MPTLESIQARVQRLEDIKQIDRIQKVYGYYRDTGQWERVVELFSDHAESVEIADHGVYRGKSGVRRFFIDLIQARRERQPLLGEMSIGMHLQGIITLASTDDTAKGRWYTLMMESIPITARRDGPLRQVWGHGIYENEFIKEDGVWKFSKLHFFLNFRTPFEDGWLKTAVIGHHGPDPDVPPDTPPTCYHPYPSGYQLKPHFTAQTTSKAPLDTCPRTALPNAAAATAETLAQLEKQVTLLEDIQQIEDLQKVYGYYFDNQMFAEVIDLFSESAESVEVTDHGVFRGKEGVKRMYSGMIGWKRPAWVFFEVMQAQGVVVVARDGRTAKGRFCTPSFEARPFGGTQKQTWQYGVYDNEYIKENGRWYFKKLHWNLTFWTSFDKGWLEQPKIADTPFAHADAPATAYHPYPSGYRVSYPWNHPLSGR